MSYTNIGYKKYILLPNDQWRVFEYSNIESVYDNKDPASDVWDWLHHTSIITEVYRTTDGRVCERVMSDRYDLPKGFEIKWTGGDQ
jgi:hypothetical protein